MTGAILPQIDRFPIVRKKAWNPVLSDAGLSQPGWAGTTPRISSLCSPPRRRYRYGLKAQRDA
ncbi:MAG: hypothetical protein VX663_02700, partial [Pseudomonadota bacterium]|nr:hypothetical protein [Pseudomonadota bacterium]